MLYSFGKYSVSIQGDAGLMLHLPVSWRCYERKEATYSISIIVTEQPNQLRNDNHQDHWEAFLSKGIYEATFFSHGYALFSVKYSRPFEYIFVSVHYDISRSLPLGIQHALMIATSGIGLHGVTIICKDKGVVFSAPSGTGKTTITKLLQKYYQAAVINGDFSLLSISPDTTLVFEPTPFCGTSQVCHNHRIQINHIVFLEQAQENIYTRLSPRIALQKVLGNAFIPTWDTNSIAAIIDTAAQIVGTVTIGNYAFMPTKEAADLIYSIVIK